MDDSSTKIEQMKKIEHTLLEDMEQKARELRTASEREAIISGALILLVLGVSLVGAFVVARSMIRSLRRLQETATKVAQDRLPELVKQLSESDPQDVDTSVESVGVHSRDEIGQVAAAFDDVHREAVRLAAEQALLRGNVNAMFTNLSRRSQGLIQRQLSLISELESREADPDQLSSLFKLDHLATRMRRNGENLLVLAGEEPGRRWTRPVPLVDVLRAAASEVEQYERIELASVPTTEVAGRVVNDLVHLLAELLENATSFSSPQTKVKVTGHALPDGRVLIEIHDTGIGLSPEDLAAINERLASPPTVDVSVSRRMGLFVVGRLSQRHGIRIQLRPSDSGGTTALVMLPVDVAQGGKKPQPASPVRAPPRRRSRPPRRPPPVRPRHDARPVAGAPAVAPSARVRRAVALRAVRSVPVPPPVAVGWVPLRVRVPRCPGRWQRRRPSRAPGGPRGPQGPGRPSAGPAGSRRCGRRLRAGAGCPAGPAGRGHGGPGQLRRRSWRRTAAVPGSGATPATAGRAWWRPAGRRRSCRARWSAGRAARRQPAAPHAELERRERAAAGAARLAGHPARSRGAGPGHLAMPRIDDRQGPGATSEMPAIRDRRPQGPAADRVPRAPPPTSPAPTSTLRRRATPAHGPVRPSRRGLAAGPGQYARQLRYAAVDERLAEHGPVRPLGRRSAPRPGRTARAARTARTTRATRPTRASSRPPARVRRRLHGPVPRAGLRQRLHRPALAAGPRRTPRRHRASSSGRRQAATTAASVPRGRRPRRVRSSGPPARSPRRCRRRAAPATAVRRCTTRWRPTGSTAASSRAAAPGSRATAPRRRSSRGVRSLRSPAPRAPPRSAQRPATSLLAQPRRTTTSSGRPNASAQPAAGGVTTSGLPRRVPAGEPRPGHGSAATAPNRSAGLACA